jgi:hypothetical protein
MSPTHYLFRIEAVDGPDSTARDCYCLLKDATSRMSKNSVKHHPQVVKSVLDALTSNLLKHVKKWHPTAYDELQKMGKADVEEYCKGKRPIESFCLLTSHLGVLARAAERANKGSEQKNLDSWAIRVMKDPAKCENDVRMLLWIARGSVPFNAVDSPEFKKWLAFCNVSAHSGDHLRRTVLPAVASHVRQLIRLRLENAPAAAVVIDGWDLNLEKIVGIVVHRVTADWKLRSEVVGLMHVSGSHTGETLSAAVTARVERFLGANTTIAAAVSDNGGNYTKACEKIASGEHWPCVLHTIQLMVRDVIGPKAVSNPAKELVRRVHDVVKAIRGDSVIRAELAAEQSKHGLDVLQLVSDNDTRWHSELAMLERFLKLYEPLEAVLARHDFHFAPADQAHVQDLVDVLLPIRLHSRALETESSVTMSLVLPHLHKIRSRELAPTPEDSDFKRQLKKDLLTKFSDRFEGELPQFE